MAHALARRFVGYGGNYRFPLEVQQLIYNFANVKTRTTALAGFDGGYDELGIRRAPQEIGNVQIRARLIAGNGQTTQDLADAWRAMAGWGTQRLFVQPMGSERLRWCWARWTYGTPNFMADKHADVYLDAESQFNVPDPGWYGIEPSASEPAYNEQVVYLDDDRLFDGSRVWGGPRFGAMVAANSMFTVVNSGKRVTRPVIKIKSGSAISRCGMRRYDAQGSVVDEWLFVDGLAAGDELRLDCQTFSVVKSSVVGDVAAFDAWQILRGLGFHELPSGESTFEWVCAQSAAIEFEFFDSWY